MVVVEDVALGLLLGVAALLLVFSIISFRRSGLRSLYLLIGGLAFHVVLTAILFTIHVYTDIFEGVDSWAVPVADAFVLVAVLVIGIVGGRLSERPA